MCVGGSIPLLSAMRFIVGRSSNKEGVMPSKETINEVLDLLIDEIGLIRDVAEDCGSEDNADRLTDIREALLDVLAYNNAARSVKVLLRMETV